MIYIIQSRRKDGGLWQFAIEGCLCLFDGPHAEREAEEELLNLRANYGAIREFRVTKWTMAE